MLRSALLNALPLSLCVAEDDALLEPEVDGVALSLVLCPDAPEEPDVPDESEAPDAPDDPAAPDEPDESEVPDDPDVPVAPEEAPLVPDAVPAVSLGLLDCT